MKVIKHKLLFSIAILVTSSSAYGQLGPCGAIGCGFSVNASFEPDGGILICEGQTITLNNTTEDPQFDYFIVDWQDGQIDTVFGYGPIIHTYNNVVDDPCAGNSEIRVEFQGIIECDEGITCSSGANDFILVPNPLADFESDPEVCVGTEICFTNNSCNGMSSFWQFGSYGTSMLANDCFTFSIAEDVEVSLTVEGVCGVDVETKTISVVAPPEATFTQAGQIVTICQNDELDLSAITNSFTNLDWSITPGPGLDSTIWCYTDPDMNDSDQDITIRFKQT
ncbi:MAG: hypothetical protein AAGF87_18990, partial [Bacteroidota bacterium]